MHKGRELLVSIPEVEYERVQELLRDKDLKLKVIGLSTSITTLDKLVVEQKKKYNDNVMKDFLMEMYYFVGINSEEEMQVTLEVGKYEGDFDIECVIIENSDQNRIFEEFFGQGMFEIAEYLTGEILLDYELFDHDYLIKGFLSKNEVFDIL